MKKPITMVIGGLGVRGYEVYASYAYRHPQNVTVVAVADPDPEKRAAAKERFHLPDSACYPDMETLLQQPRLADVAVIATQDRQHIAHALPALEKGYHLLLEKPISPDVQACIALRDTAHRCGRVVAVAHVLRYTEIFSAVKQLLQQGAIGKLIHMDLIENVAYWHFAHSYVRGNWRRAEETSPMILAKSCHGQKRADGCRRPLPELRGRAQLPVQRAPHLSGKRKNRRAARQHRLAMLGAGRPPDRAEHHPRPGRRSLRPLCLRL